MPVSYSQIQWQSIWAGIVLGLAGYASVLASVGTEAPVLIKALIFPIGLILIILNQWSLFTGNVYKVIYGRKSRTETLGTLGVSFLGNLIGSLAVSILIVGTAPESILNLFRDTAMTKASLSLISAFFLAVPCNFLVCMAVHLALKASGMIEKTVVTLIPVFLFVACGFEHVVADMLYLPFFPINAIVPFFLVVTAGNIFGGALYAHIVRPREGF